MRSGWHPLRMVGNETGCSYGTSAHSDRGRRQDPRPGTAAGSRAGSGWRCREDLRLPLPTLRWAEMAHRPCGLAAVSPGCDTADLPDEDRGQSRGCARPWPDDARCRDPAAVVAVGTVLRAGSAGEEQWFGEMDLGAVGAPGAPSAVGLSLDAKAVVDLGVVSLAEQRGILQAGLAAVDPLEHMMDVAPVGR